MLWSAGEYHLENWPEGKESIRSAAAMGSLKLQKLKLSCLEVILQQCRLLWMDYTRSLWLLPLKQQPKMVVTVKLHGSTDQENWQNWLLDRGRRSSIIPKCGQRIYWDLSNQIIRWCSCPIHLVKHPLKKNQIQKYHCTRFQDVLQRNNDQCSLILA